MEMEAPIGNPHQHKESTKTQSFSLLTTAPPSYPSSTIKSKIKQCLVLDPARSSGQYTVDVPGGAILGLDALPVIAV